MKKKQDRPFKSGVRVTKVNKNLMKENKHSITSTVPSIIPFSLSDKIIKDRTGFVNEVALISFIIVVCNGDFDVIKSTQSHRLTWYEEWFFILKLFGEGVIHDGMISWQKDLG